MNNENYKNNAEKIFLPFLDVMQEQIANAIDNIKEDMVNSWDRDPYVTIRTCDGEPFFHVSIGECGTDEEIIFATEFDSCLENVFDEFKDSCSQEESDSLIYSMDKLCQKIQDCIKKMKEYDFEE